MAPVVPEESAPSPDDETAELPPPAPGTAREDDPTDRVPPWLFRPDEPAGDDRTREMPAVQPVRRPRSDWAEETPLDDLPTLADELLGPHDPQNPPPA
jgi:dTMP kinase